MKRVLAAAAVLAMVSGPAVAQRGQSTNNMETKTPLELQYERDKREQQESARAYDEHMKRQKTQGSSTGAKSDPWAGVRPAADGKR